MGDWLAIGRHGELVELEHGVCVRPEDIRCQCCVWYLADVSAPGDDREGYCVVDGCNRSAAVGVRLTDKCGRFKPDPRHCRVMAPPAAIPLGESVSPQGFQRMLDAFTRFANWPPLQDATPQDSEAS